MAWGPPVPERPPSLISAILALSADGVGDGSLGDILNTSDQWRASPSFLGGRYTGGPRGPSFPDFGKGGCSSGRVPSRARPSKKPRMTHRAICDPLEWQRNCVTVDIRDDTSRRVCEENRGICSENRTEIEILGSFAGPFQSRNPFPHTQAPSYRSAWTGGTPVPTQSSPHTIPVPTQSSPHTIPVPTQSCPPQNPAPTQQIINAQNGPRFAPRWRARARHRCCRGEREAAARSPKRRRPR